jgi:hypothetical protein
MWHWMAFPNGADSKEHRTLRDAKKYVEENGQKEGFRRDK